MVNRSDRREDARASGPFLMNHGFGDFGGFLRAGSGDQHNDDVLLLFSHQVTDGTRNSFFSAMFTTFFSDIKI